MFRSVKALLLAVAVGCVAFAQSPKASAPTVSAPDDKSGAYYHFAMGRLYAELAELEGNKNDYVSKAIQHYQDALKLDPSANIIFEELTDLYIQTGKVRDAVSQAEELLKQNPDNLEARRMLGRIYTRAAGGNPQAARVDEESLRKATEQYQKITAKDPKDVESWVMLARLYRVSNKSPEAEKAYNAALAVDPDNEDALTGVAMLYSDIGDTKRAIEKLKAVTDKSPNERTLAALAGAYEQLKDYKDAAEVLRKAVALAPDNPRLRAGLAEDLLYSDQLDEALKLYRQLAAEEPRDANNSIRLSQIYRQQHEYAKAREALNKAKALDPESIEIRYEEISLLEAEGKSTDAIAALKSLLDSTAKKNYSAAESSNRAMLLERLGVLYRGNNQFPQALDAFNQIGPLSTEGAPRVAVQIIDTYRSAKDLDNSLRRADAALKEFPNERMVVLEHASVLADLGKTDQAAAEIRNQIKGDHDLDAQFSLAEVYQKAKRWDDMGKALDEADRIATADKEQAASLNDTEKSAAADREKSGVLFLRGAMYERMKKLDLAEETFRKVLQIAPDNAGALNYLGYMLADRDVRLEEAHQLIKKALDLDPDNGAYLDSLGWLYFRQGKLPEAEGLLIRALDRIGQDPAVHDHLGDIYFKQGKVKDAIAQWQTSLKEYKTGLPIDNDPEEVAKVSRKLESARVRLAQETHKK